MDQRNNEHSTDQQPKKNEEQESSDSTKHETTLCATCERNFKTSRGLIQHQKKCRPSENTNNITIHNITIQLSTEIKFRETFPSWTYNKLFPQHMRKP